MKKNIRFVDSLLELTSDALIVQELPSDDVLREIVSINLKRFSPPFVMTTNGKYHIPKVAMATQVQDIAHLACDKEVAICLSGGSPERQAFDILAKKPLAETVFFVCPDSLEIEKKFFFYQTILESLERAKQLISAPANVMTPSAFALSCTRLIEERVRVTILHEHELSRIGAEALLAVGRGSSHPPRIVVMEWCGNDEDPVVLVGKGICFDSGGINLKSSYITEMKWDKAGAGAVVGVIDVLSKLKAPVHVVGIAVLAENMPDGASLRPGDIIGSLGGKTIEVVDTDCEGRLALADGLAYAQLYFSPQAIIDLGTLTLEVFGALGGEYAGLFCTDPKLSKDLIEAGELSGEKLWPLPMGEYYAEQIRSKVADIKNVGVFRYGGSSAAAEFLRCFVKPSIPFAHIDIAGTAWDINAPEKGVSAFGLQLLVSYLMKFSC
jgi:leucyl aminopeptidase